jgi:hypothetical protein
MQTFSQTVAGWHDFYLLVGTAAATLVGLLFLALSLNAHLILGEDNTGSRILARQTFANFLSVVTFAALFLIPDPGPLGLGVPLAFIGAAGLYGVARRAVVSRRTHVRAFNHRSIIRHLVVSGACFLALIVVAVSLLFEQTAGLYWLIPVMLVLIAGASQNAWELLLGQRPGSDMLTADADEQP